MRYASEFGEIEECMRNNDTLKTKIIDLVKSEPIPGKSIEGNGRLDALRIILINFFDGKLSFSQAIEEIEFRLPRQYSPHENNNRVFPQGWAERLVRTNISCFYNQAVLIEILESGNTECYIEHSSAEGSESNCSLQLAGKQHDTKSLLEKLINSYRNGNWSSEVKLPDHPHCTHTAQPVNN